MTTFCYSVFPSIGPDFSNDAFSFSMKHDNGFWTEIYHTKDYLVLHYRISTILLGSNRDVEFFQMPFEIYGENYNDFSP